MHVITSESHNVHVSRHMRIVKGEITTFSKFRRKNSGRKYLLTAIKGH